MKLMKHSKKGNMNALFTTFLGLISLSLILVIAYVFYAQTLSMTVVSSDGNATASIQNVRDASNIAVSFLPIIVLATVGFGILGIFLGKKFSG